MSGRGCLRRGCLRAGCHPARVSPAGVSRPRQAPRQIVFRAVTDEIILLGLDRSRMNGPFIRENSDEWSIHRSRTRVRIRVKGTIHMKHRPLPGRLAARPACPAERSSGGLSSGGQSSGGHRRAVIRRAVIRRAVIRRAVIRRAVIRRAVIRRAVIRRAAIRRAVIPRAVIRRAVSWPCQAQPARSCARSLSGGPRFGVPAAGSSCSGLAQFGRPATSSEFGPAIHLSGEHRRPVRVIHNL